MIQIAKVVSILAITFVLSVGVHALIKSRTALNGATLTKINKLYLIGDASCKEGGSGISMVVYNTILLHEVHCSDGTVIKYTK